MPEGIVSDSPWPSVGTEAFRLLYSSLAYGWQAESRTILVTSVAPQEGKTTVATNLAVTFAREGARVLLVDCDVRRPRIHRIFRVARSPGLIDLLRNAHQMRLPAPAMEQTQPEGRSFSMFSDLERSAARPEPNGTQVSNVAPQAETFRLLPGHIRSTGVKGLSVLPCGTLPSKPAEELRVGTLRSMLDALAGDFDLIVLDTPPVLASADAPILAPLADGVLLVIRAGGTDREAAERAYHQLTAAGASVVGTVLNDPSGELTRSRKLYYSYDYPVAAD